MVKEAAEFDAVDKLDKDKIDAKSRLGNFFEEITNRLSDKALDDKITSAEITTIKDTIEECNKWIHQNMDIATKYDVDEKREILS
jgi:heat shock protein 1/8